MKKEKKWVLVTLAATTVLLVATAVSTIVIDPFFQYRMPLEELEYPIINEAYQNAGIVKNYKYDKLVTGSSMTENFKASSFGEGTVKVCYSGAYPKTGKEIISTAAQNNPELEKVFWGLDVFTLVGSAEETGQKMPKYLYNSSYLDDVNYVCNKDVLFTWIPMIIKNTRDGVATPNLDEAYAWYKSYEFSEKEALKKYQPVESNAQPTVVVQPDEEVQSERKSNVQKNLEENIIPIIKENPGIEFHVYLPPYSILFWRASAEEYLGYEELLCRELLKLNNVKVYSFQSEKEIVCNLYLYKDNVHHNEQVSDYIAEHLDSDEYRLTEGNYREEFKKIKVLAEGYDFDSLIGTKEALKRETNLEYYLKKLKEKEYMIIAAGNSDVEDAHTQYGRSMLKEYGFADDFLEENEKEYITVMDGEETIFSETEESAGYEKDIQYNELNMEVIKDKGERNGIWIDGIRYSYLKDEFNIVVWDKNEKKVVDSAGIDLSQMLLIR